MSADAPKVFVSYAHESAEHEAQVLEFATFLRGVGVAADLDVWSDHQRQDWYSWAIREMTAANFVVVVASARYRAVGDGSGPAGENRGVQSEAALLREQVYADRATWLAKVLPVLLPGHTTDEIPLFLQPHSASNYPVPSFDVAGAGNLLRVIFGKPGHPAPAVGTEPALPPHAPPVGDRPRVFNQITGVVHGTVVQADTINGDLHF
jgi:SEFIR domain-containing protein